MNETSQNLCQTIETFIQTAQFDALIDTSKLALSDARDRNDKSTEVICLLGLAEGHKFIGKFKEARLLVDGATTLATQLQDTKLIVLSLLASGRIYIATTFQADEAERDFRQALRLAHDINDQVSVADALNGISSALGQMDEVTRAQRFARKAFDVARDGSYHHGMGVALSLIGSASMKAKPEKAMQAFEDAMAIAQQDNFRLLELRLMGYIGQLLCREERYADDGQMMLEKMLAMAKDFRSVPDEFTALYRLGRAFEQRKSLERSAQYYGMMLEQAQTWRARSYEGFAFFNLGLLAHHRKHYDDAISNLEQAIAIARETKNPYQEAQIEQVLGATCLESKDYNSALDHYMAARSLYDSLDNAYMANQLLQQMIIVYLQRLLNNVLQWIGLRNDDTEISE